MAPCIVFKDTFLGSPFLPLAQLENISMSQQPTYEELEQRVKDFEKMAADHERTDGE